MAPDSCWSCGTTHGIHLCGCSYACQEHCPIVAPDTYNKDAPG